MNSIEELWDTTWNTPWFNGSYHDLVKDFGKVILDDAFGDYQGDYIYVFKNDNKYGFLIVGYGSCSGCDALEACESLTQVLALQMGLKSNVKWFDNVDDLKTYILDDNRELNWYSHENGWEEFVNKVKEL